MNYTHTHIAVVFQLMERPLNLYLAPEEMYPPCRKASLSIVDILGFYVVTIGVPYLQSDELPPSHPFIVEDMPRMAHYVYHLYNRRMQEMQSQTRVYQNMLELHETLSV